MKAQLDLNDIRTFVAVTQAGTLSGAARDLGLPTSTVSRAITRLESALGLLLVQRSPRGFLLTDAGKEYLFSCKRALRALRDGGELMEKHRGNPGGLIRVSCPITMARDLLAPILKEFIDAYPHLRIEIEPYSSAWNQEPREEIDVFFKVRTPKNSSWRVRNYPGTRRGLFASRSYLARAGTPTEPSQLSAHRCIGAGTWRLSRGTRLMVLEVSFQVVGSDPGVHLELAAKGVGIAILPMWMARRPEMQQVLSPVLPTWHPDPITLCALYTGPARFTPKVKVFLDFIDDYIGTARDPRLSTNKPKDLFTDRHLSTPLRSVEKHFQERSAELQIPQLRSG
jgi:LysR family transcriptional regulator, transcriptional activator for dmlA